MNNNNPSIDPADNGSLSGMMQFVFKKLMQGQVSNRLPASVIAYDRATNRAQVQILIMIKTTDGSLVSRQQVASVPVLILGGGGFIISAPLVTGDLGWLCACDRDISLFLQSYLESPPNTARMFSFSDGVFVPDKMTGYTIGGEDANNLVIQNLDGTVKISLGEDSITISAPTIELDGDLTASGSISFGAGAEITGDLAVIGNITATGDITPHVPP